MSSDSSRSVKIRLEIDVPQGGPEPVVRQRLKDRPFTIVDSNPSITYPANGNQQVNARQDSQTGQLIICTAGTNTSKNRPLFYQLTLGTTTSPASQPPQGASWMYADGNGDWNFELPLPAGSGPYTIVMWNDDDNFDPSFSNFNVKNTGVTDCGSGSGGHFEAVKDAAPGLKVPRTLYAHVSNAGALNKVYALAYDPNTKAWSSDAVCGALGFQLMYLGNAWQLHVKSARIHHPAVALGGPFQIVFKNVDLNTSGHGGAKSAEVEILVSR